MVKDKNDTRSSNINYKEKIVAFVDILGFSSKIVESQEDDSLRLSIYNILKTFNGMVESPNTNNKSIDVTEKKVSSFSDNIVISYSNKLSFIDAIYDLGRLQIECIKQGFLVRGGITIGDIIHTKEVVFGQGFVDAYKIENEISIYPRIAFTEQTMNDGIKSGKFANYSDNDQDLRTIEMFVKKDFDGLYYIDFLSLNFFEDNELKSDQYFSQISRICFVDILPIKVKQKYDWFKEKYINFKKELHESASSISVSSI